MTFTSGLLITCIIYVSVPYVAVAMLFCLVLKRIEFKMIKFG